MTAPRPILREPLFYRAALDTADEVMLTGDEANHVKAQRLKPGDGLALFDGLGLIADGKVQWVGRREIRIAILRRRRESPPAPRIELYCAVPKGERVAVLLDMATQLGLSRFAPVRWARSIVDPGARARDRWQRICIEACKQSRRPHVPEIVATATVEDAAMEARASGALLLLAHPDGGAKSAPTRETTKAERIALFVGPEGGLTDDELKTLRDQGAHLVNLGSAILRIETAAIALIATVNAACDGRHGLHGREIPG